MKIAMILWFFMFWFAGIFMGWATYGAFLSKSTTYTNKQTPVESVHDSRFRSFEYHGHRYLKYTDTVQAFSATLHDPDCPCLTNRLEEQHAGNQ